MSNPFEPYTDTKNYRCMNCGTSGLVRLQDFDRFWICLAPECRQPIDVEMRHSQVPANVWINRIPASALQAGDYLAEENKRALTTEVITSGPAVGKSNKWYLALQEIGHVTIEPDRLYDRIIF